MLSYFRKSTIQSQIGESGRVMGVVGWQRFPANPTPPKGRELSSVVYQLFRFDVRLILARTDAVCVNYSFRVVSVQRV